MPGFLATFDKASTVFQIHIGRLKHFPPTLIPAGDSKTVQNLKPHYLYIKCLPLPHNRNHSGAK